MMAAVLSPSVGDSSTPLQRDVQPFGGVGGPAVRQHEHMSDYRLFIDSTSPGLLCSLINLSMGRCLLPIYPPNFTIFLKFESPLHFCPHSPDRHLQHPSLQRSVSTTKGFCFSLADQLKFSEAKLKFQCGTKQKAQNKTKNHTFIYLNKTINLSTRMSN